MMLIRKNLSNKGQNKKICSEKSSSQMNDNDDKQKT